MLVLRDVSKNGRVTAVHAEYVDKKSHQKQFIFFNFYILTMFFIVLSIYFGKIAGLN